MMGESIYKKCISDQSLNVIVVILNIKSVQYKKRLMLRENKAYTAGSAQISANNKRAFGEATDRLSIDIQSLMWAKL